MKTIFTPALPVFLLTAVVAGLFTGAARAELSAADAEAAPPEQRAAAKFLIDNMPEGDRKSLTREFLLENVALAFQARKAHDWAAAVPEDIFLNYVLPYASVNEARDNWRKDFNAKWEPVVKDCKSCGEVALKLNATIFKTLNVSYHPTKRPKPDQNPTESIKAGFASCTGLSILLIDACRSVGVPARFVGTPSWTTGKGDANGNHGGNHSWVEIWDGQWHILGAIEVSALDQTWFLGNASKADITRPVNCIYATSFKKTGLSYPLIWAQDVEYVQADNVTQSYLKRTPMKLEVLTQPGGAAVKAHVTVKLKGQLIADKEIDGVADFILSGGQEYEVAIKRPGYDSGPTTFKAPDEKGRVVSLIAE